MTCEDASEDMIYNVRRPARPWPEVVELSESADEYCRACDDDQLARLLAHEQRRASERHGTLAGESAELFVTAAKGEMAFRRLSRRACA